MLDTSEGYGQTVFSVLFFTSMPVRFPVENSCRPCVCKPRHVNKTQRGESV
jgi:hypothetical protein